LVNGRADGVLRFDAHDKENPSDYGNSIQVKSTTHTVPVNNGKDKATPKTKLGKITARKKGT